MTADKTPHTSEDPTYDPGTGTLGRWEWVPVLRASDTPLVQSSTSNGPQSGQDTNTTDPDRRPRESLQSDADVCAFGHPVLRSADHVHAVHSSQSQETSIDSESATIQQIPSRSQSTPSEPVRDVGRAETRDDTRPQIDTLAPSSRTGTPLNSPAASPVQRPVGRGAEDQALLVDMMASASVSSSTDQSSHATTSTLSSQADPPPEYDNITPSLDELLFYHRDTVVPLPAGMVPLPPLPSNERPLEPETSSSSTQYEHLYISFVSTLPGLDSMTWNMWRPRIESHRGFPKPYRPEFRAPNNREQAYEMWANRLRGSNGHESPVRVLPPPPRPPVEFGGPHWWVVYIGRVPGIYNNAPDVIAQTSGFPGAQAEIFSDEDAAWRWYWYARARGFLVPLFGGRS